MSIKILVLKTIMICFLLMKIHAIQNHLICHSHNSLGWLKKIDQYYTENVRSIFESVLESLESCKAESESKRKFVFSEVGFLKMFIEEIPEKRKEKIEKIKKFIKNGQLEFVNGGMSQSDEASPYYDDIILNYFAGLRYLKKNFNTTSSACWQLNTYGHSKTLHYQNVIASD